jgi:integrase/recombinase XerD
MLRLYRRHQRHCPHLPKGRKHLRCQCPLWVDGRLKGRRIHKSLCTTDWQKAQQIVRAWEVEGGLLPLQPRAPERITLEQAWARFLADLVARNLHPSTARKYRLLSRQISEYADQYRLRFLDQFDFPALAEFRATWKESPLTRSKKLERLRSFFLFAHESNWINENPARKLKGPKLVLRPTLPFTDQEMVRILGALDPYIEQTDSRGKENARRLRALVLVLRYSGMRMGDVVRLTADQVNGNKLLLHTQKTGIQVSAVLPEFVASLLETSPKVAGKCFLWSGTGKLDVIVGSWQRRLRKLFSMAGVSDGHAHRFRHTFAVSLLIAGIPMERVSILLGHQSVRVTEKNCAAWTDSRQRQVEADLQRAWEQDPIVMLEAKVTRRLRGNIEAVN